MYDQKPSPKRRIRFAIRDLLWLALVVALGTAWWMDHQAMQNYKTYYEYHSELDRLYERNKINYGPLAK